MSLNIKKIYPILLSVLVGVIAAFIVFSFQSKEEDHAHHFGSEIPTTDLEEYMYFVDAVVVGKVIEQKETYIQDSGLPTKVPFEFPVTPAIIQVLEVIDGEIVEKEITLLQHGDEKDSSLVTIGDEYVFLLQEHPEEGYWPLNGNAGKFQVVNDQVVNNQILTSKSNNLSTLMKVDNHLGVNDFKEQIAEAAKNRKKPEALR